MKKIALILHFYVYAAYAALYLIYYCSPHFNNEITAWGNSLIYFFIEFTKVLITFFFFIELLKIIFHFIRFKSFWPVYIYNKYKNSTIYSVFSFVTIVFSAILTFMIIPYYKINNTKLNHELTMFLSDKAPISNGIWTYGETYIVYCKNNKIEKEVINSDYFFNKGVTFIYNHNNQSIDSIEGQYRGGIGITYFKPGQIDLRKLRLKGEFVFLEMDNQIDSTKSETFINETKQVLIEICKGPEVSSNSCRQMYYSASKSKKYIEDTSSTSLSHTLRMVISRGLSEQFDLTLDSIIYTNN